MRTHRNLHTQQTKLQEGQRHFLARVVDNPRLDKYWISLQSLGCTYMGTNGL